MISDKNRDITDGDKSRRLQDETHLAPFRKKVLDGFVGREDCQVYRTVKDIPTGIEDQTPRDLRKHQVPGSALARIFTEEEVMSMSYDRALRAVGKFGLSVNDSADAAIRSCCATYRKLKDRGADPTELDRYKDSRGEFVVRLNIDSDKALMSEFKNHHANIFLYDGVNLNELIDSEFNPIKIDYENG